MQSSVATKARASLLGLFIATTSLCARAQADAAAARQLFEEARDLAKQGKYSEACPRFEQSYQRDPGIGTLFNLADCWEHIGRTASAWAKFRDVADEAARTNQRGREQVASKRADDLLLRLSKVVVRIESNAKGLEVLRDGIAMTHADQGKPFPLDPGEHLFEARAPGKNPWRASVVVPPDGHAIEVVVPTLLDAERPDPVVEAAPTKPEAIEPVKSPAPVVAPPAPKEPTADRPASESNQKTIAYVIGGSGIVALAGGTYFGLRVLSKNDEADSICPKNADCDEQDQTNLDAATKAARTARTLAFVGFGVGGAALVTSAVLYFAAPTAKPAAWQLVPVVSIGSVGTVLQGAF